jgi:hypothetical protein
MIFLPLLLKDAKKIGEIKISTIFYFVVVHRGITAGVPGAPDLRC